MFPAVGKGSDYLNVWLNPAHGTVENEQVTYWLSPKMSGSMLGPGKQHWTFTDTVY